MIARKYRFRGRKSLDYVYKKGRTVRAGPLSLKYISLAQEDYRLAVVVSKKVSKSAVKRNRIRRRIYEHVRKTHKKVGRPIKYSMIITVFGDEVASIEASKLESYINKLLEQSKIMA